MLATFLLLGFLQASLTAESFEELLARGLRLLDQQQWQEAEAAFRKATKLEPQAPSPQVELSRLYLKQGKPELALTALDEALRWSRGDFIILYLRGQALLQLGHYPEATLELEAALVKRPGDKACLTALAQAFLRSGEPARALEILATPVISENSNTLVHALRSLALAQLGHIEEAEAFLNQAKESEHPPWVLLYVGRTELALGRPIEAAESFRKGRQLDGPFVFDFTLALTEAALDRGDSVEARRLLTPLLSSNPNRSESWFLMGLVEEAEGKYTLAVRAFTESLATGNNARETHLRLGLAQARAGDHAAAWDTFEKTLKLDPTESETYYYMGHLLSKEERFQESIPFFERAERLDPNDIRITLALAQAHLELGHYPMAIEAADRAFELDSKNGKAHYMKALANYSLQKFATSELGFRDAIDLGIGSAEIYFNWGLSLVAMNHLRKAREAFTDAVQLDSQLAEAHLEMGRTSSQLGDYEAALASLSQAIELLPNNADVYDEMGVAESRQGHSKKAIKLWEKALILDPAQNHLYYRLGTELVRVNRVKEGEKLLEEFQLRSAETEVANQRAARAENILRRALELSKEREDKEALRFFDEAIEIDPENALPYVALAEFHLSRGRQAEAEATIVRGVALNPESLQMHELLLSLYEATGNESGVALTKQRIEELRNNHL